MTSSTAPVAIRTGSTAFEISSAGRLWPSGVLGILAVTQNTMTGLDNKQHAIETYKSMISIGVEATKSMLYLNGGAVVAMLAYMGQSNPGIEAAMRARTPLMWFVLGIVAAAMSFLFGYLTQNALFNETQGRTLRVAHQAWQWTTVGALVIAVAAFAGGAWTAIWAFGAP